MCKHLPSYKDLYLFVYMSMCTYIYLCVYIHSYNYLYIYLYSYLLSLSLHCPPHLQDETENLKSRVVLEVVIQPLMNE